MERKIFTCIIIMSGLLLSCKPKINDYYAGFVVDELGQPLMGVVIKENTEIQPLETRTDENGFFKLTRSEGIICNLRIEKEGYKPETVLSFYYYAKNQEEGEFEYSSFLTSDTTKVVLYSDLKQSEENFIDDEENQSIIKYSFKGVSEITAENTYSRWAYLQDSISSLAFIFGHNSYERDTLLLCYSTECWLAYPYKVENNMIVAYWDIMIDTKYQFDIVRAIEKVDENLIGKPFMIFELINDTTLKVTYPMKDLIKKINQSARDNNRIFFPDTLRIVHEDYAGYYW